jgi:hypothetical protein
MDANAREWMVFFLEPPMDANAREWMVLFLEPPMDANAREWMVLFLNREHRENRERFFGFADACD